MLRWRLGTEHSPGTWRGDERRSYSPSARSRAFRDSGSARAAHLVREPLVLRPRRSRAPRGAHPGPEPFVHGMRRSRQTRAAPAAPEPLARDSTPPVCSPGFDSEHWPGTWRPVQCHAQVLQSGWALWQHAPGKDRLLHGIRSRDRRSGRLGHAPLRRGRAVEAAERPQPELDQSCRWLLPSSSSAKARSQRSALIQISGRFRRASTSWIATSVVRAPPSLAARITPRVPLIWALDPAATKELRAARRASRSSIRSQMASISIANRMLSSSPGPRRAGAGGEASRGATTTNSPAS